MDNLDEVLKRIEELSEKATQLLLFLTFALVAAVTLRVAPVTTLGQYQGAALKLAMRFWTGALFPILVSVLPVKELTKNLVFVRHFKAALLWLAIVLIAVGAGAFLLAIW